MYLCEPPRILHLRASNFLGSPERLILGQVKYGRHFRHVPVSYTRKCPPTEFASALASERVEHYLLQEICPGDFSTIARLASLIRKLQPYLVVTHDYKSNLWGSIACALTGTPQVVHFHGHTAEGLRVYFYNEVDKRAIRHATAVITVAETLKEYLSQLGIAKEQISVVHNAVPDSAFEPTAQDLGLRLGGAPFFGAVGRLSYEKGFDMLLDAYASHDFDAHLVIFGSGPEQHWLEGRVARLGLRRKIHFAGHIKDLRPAYAAMQFLVIPSRSEGFPLVLLEAWAQATPVVATPAGAIGSLISNNDNGMLADDISSKSIARALSQAVQIHDFKQRCGSNARRLAWARYRFNDQVPVLETLYERILESNALLRPKPEASHKLN